MLNRISRASTKVLLNQGIILESKENIYIYGFQVIYSTLCCFASILILGILWNREWETVVFIIYFVIVRQAVGGYHASTYRNCFLITNMAYILENILSMLIAGHAIVTWGIFAFSILYTYLKAPSPNIHRKMTESKREQHRKKAIGYIGVCVLSMIIFYVLNFQVIMPVIASTMAIIAGMIYINEKGGL